MIVIKTVLLIEFNCWLMRFEFFQRRTRLRMCRGDCCDLCSNRVQSGQLVRCLCSVFLFAMVLSKARAFIVLACHFDVLMCLDPIASLAEQPVWQAAEPIAVTVDYDVPAFGPQDVALDLQTLSSIENVYGLRRHTPMEDTAHVLTPEHRDSASFLSTRVLPVDADRIKKSVFLTEPLRSPPQASVNIIMHEDVKRMKDAFKYHGMVDQTLVLQNEFKKGLADLSKGVA